MYESTENTILKNFGNNLKQLRVNANISQEELATQTNLDRTYISGLERGKRNPSLLTLLKLTQTLSIPIEKLFKGGNNVSI